MANQIDSQNFAITRADRLVEKIANYLRLADDPLLSSKHIDFNEDGQTIHYENETITIKIKTHENKSLRSTG